MVLQWMTQAVVFAITSAEKEDPPRRISESEISRRLCEKTGRKEDNSLIYKIKNGRGLSAEDMLALAEITGFPLPPVLIPGTETQPLPDEVVLSLLAGALEGAGSTPVHAETVAAAMLELAREQPDPRSADSALQQVRSRAKGAARLLSRR